MKRIAFLDKVFDRPWIRILTIIAFLAFLTWRFFPSNPEDYNVESIQPATVVSIINTQSKYSSGFVSISAKLPDGKLTIIKLPRYETRNVGDDIFVEVSVNAKGKKLYKLSDKEN